MVLPKVPLKRALSSTSTGVVFATHLARTDFELVQIRTGQTIPRGPCLKIGTIF